ncbi:MAG: hypothetical protein IT337_12685 [Thermomicrobiales bacterium]|nr:hypothetical protein [Thermomicrobiales bacterium]
MPNLFLQMRDDADDVTPAPLNEAEALAVLGTAEIGSEQLIPWGSNYSFAVALRTDEGRAQLAIYKPQAGEAPLYDFPEGTLYQREVAAYRLSRWLEWDLVPPTVVRDGPHGIGSLQLYIEPDPERTDSPRAWGACAPEIERIVLFDHIANNADRKIGHCLRDKQGKAWGIDHGLTFNHVPKLRTVLWQYVGEPISSELMDDLQRLVESEAEVRAELAPYLSEPELDAVFARAGRLWATGRYPNLSSRRNVPYGWW